MSFHQSKKYCLALLLLVITFVNSNAHPVRRDSQSTKSQQPERRFWVTFTDKGDASQNEIKRRIIASSKASAKTLLRRSRLQGSVCNEKDLPVFQPYIDEVIRFGADLCIQSRWLNAITIKASEDAVSKILKLPFVESVESVYTSRMTRLKKDYSQPAPSANYYDSQSSAKYYGMSYSQISLIHADALHNRDYHGEGVTIAVLDTGFDLSHKALRSINVKAQYDFVNDDNNTLDEPPVDDIGQDDHGTQVLSVLGGYSPEEFVGIAYGAEYLLAKTEKVSDKGSFYEQQIEEDWWVAGLEWAELNGADIVTSSLGYSEWYLYSDMNGSTAKTTIAANIAVEKGIAVIASAGNEGKSQDWPYISAPSDGFDVIAVGAVKSDGSIADFSSIGPTYDGRIKPDLVAMGEGCYVVDPNNKNGYRIANGTSMSAPLVAGVIALLKQSLPSIDNPRTLAKLVKYTASRALNPDNRYGWGIANADAAYRYATFPGSMKELNNWDPNGSMSESSEVMIYPNPITRRSSTGRLNIRSSKSISSIEIYSITGSLVYKRDNLDSAHFISWDLKNEYNRNVASGIYVCVIKDISGRSVIKKLAIKN